MSLRHHMFGVFPNSLKWIMPLTITPIAPMILHVTFRLIVLVSVRFAMMPPHIALVVLLSVLRFPAAIQTPIHDPVGAVFMPDMSQHVAP